MFNVFNSLKTFELFLSCIFKIYYCCFDPIKCKDLKAGHTAGGGTNESCGSYRNPPGTKDLRV